MKVLEYICLTTSFLFLFTSANFLFAQHDHHNMKMENDNEMQHDTMLMTSVFSNNLPMNRDGSGTSWQPDATLMMMYMKKLGKDAHSMTSLMVHGNLFFRYTLQDITNQGSRGGQKIDAPNWLMFALSHKHTKDVFSILSMISLDPLTEGGNGYPLLFQTGETYNNIPLVDRQHPHDLFSELAINYTHSFTKDIDINIYLGYPGEPALGSNAFMHRFSSMYNPDAPLSHHWNDGTHITFGVATLGIRYSKFKLEGSSFKGKEPDENRYDFDRPMFDSYSGRLSFNPSMNWSFQVSQGFVKSPEVLHPEENINRTTASAIYSCLLGMSRFISATALWGLNSGESDENAALLEATLVLNRLAVYSRYEWVEKSAKELNLQQFINGTTPIFPVNAITVGLSYDLIHSKFLNMAIGGQGSYFSADSRLDNIYGKNPLSAEVFIRFYPPRML